MDLPRLSQVRSLDEVPMLGCVESPGPHCGLFEAALTGPFFADGMTLLIGAPACLYHARMTLLPRTRVPAGLRDNLLLLPVEQTDAVFGIEGRLMEAIEEADRRYQPRLLFLVSTCIPEMIGTDLEAVAQMMQPRVRARLLPVRTDGFSGRHLLQGQRRLLASLIRAMEPLPVRPNSVNVLGLRGFGGRETELVRWLEDRGAEVITVLPAEATFVQIQRAPAAALNLVASEMGIDLAEAMEARFGTPFLYVGQPLSPEQIRETYSRIAAVLGFDPGPAPNRLTDLAGRELASVRRRTRGMRAAVAMFTGGALEAALFLSDLGVEPALLLLSRLSGLDEPDRERLLRRGIDPPVARTRSTLETAGLLRALGPQLFVGHGDPSAMARLGVAHVPPDPPRALWGFEAARWAAEAIDHAACEQTPMRKEGGGWA